MPLYEFICQTCGRRFEALVRIGREQEICCESCGGADLKKLFSSFGIGGGASRIKSSSAGCATCSAKSCSTCK